MGTKVRMSAGFVVAIDRTDPVVVMTTEGDMDTATASRLDACVETAIRDYDRHVVLDASRITFVDSTGITALVSALRRLNRSRRRLALAVGTRSPLGRALEVTGLDHTFEIFRTVDEAVEALAGAPLIGR